jgi:hypothetical protein
MVGGSAAAGEAIPTTAAIDAIQTATAIPTRRDPFD